MSNVVPFSQRPVPATDVATKRLFGIWKNVEMFTCCIQLERLTPGEMSRVLRMFDTANACIQIVLSDFREDPAIDQLINQSREIKALIETARQKVACLTPKAATRLA